MKILLTKTLPTEEGQYYWRRSELEAHAEVFVLTVWEDGEGEFWCADEQAMPCHLPSCRDLGGYWAKVDQSMFQLCESEQERREIIQKQHSNDTHRAVDIDRPEPECKCDSPDLKSTNASDHGNTHICLNCVGWSKGVEA